MITNNEDKKPTIKIKSPDRFNVNDLNLKVDADHMVFQDLFWDSNSCKYVPSNYYHRYHVPKDIDPVEAIQEWEAVQQQAFDLNGDVY